VTHDHDLPGPDERFGKPFWEERYRSSKHLWSGNPNRHLTAQVADLPPGAALDIGCGEGADAIWLAQHGWRVTAIDVSDVALERARDHAAAAGVADRISFGQADVRSTQPAAAFDLVNLQYMHLPVGNYRRFAELVGPGGVLLVAAHHPSDLQTTMPRPPIPELFFTAEELAAQLEPAQWQILLTAAVPHQTTDPDGRDVTVHDTVFKAKRPA
jgi:2-polyprenyl-3-methyl-5-hydroxy-6-metoxy-1,4-benzoquinol methylase